MPRVKFEYTAFDIWFECSFFDEFLNQLNVLKSGVQAKAEFYDMSREVVLTFTNDQIVLTVHRSHSEIGSGYLGSVDLSVYSSVAHEKDGNRGT